MGEEQIVEGEEKSFLARLNLICLGSTLHIMDKKEHLTWEITAQSLVRRTGYLETFRCVSPFLQINARTQQNR